MRSPRVDLWYAVVPGHLERSLRLAYEAMLRPEERARQIAFRDEHCRVEYLLTRALVRWVLSQHEPCSPRDWQFVTDGRGRPELDEPRSFRFSLANCPALVVCAVTWGADVGVDAEPHVRGASILEMGDRVFSAEERVALTTLGSRDERESHAILLWTLKEAYLKALGTGLLIALPSLSFDGRDGGLALRVDGERVGAWAFATVAIAGHRIALAVRGVGNPVLQIREAVPLVDATRRPEIEASVVMLSRDGAAQP